MKNGSGYSRTKGTKGTKGEDEEMGRRPSGKTPEQIREERKLYMRQYRAAHREELNAKRREKAKENQLEYARSAARYWQKRLGELERQALEVNPDESKQKSSEIDRNTPEIDQAADKGAGGTD